MTSRKTRTRKHRRDRRKAKETGYARAGTSNPKKVGHHHVDEAAFMDEPDNSPPVVRPWEKKKEPKPRKRRRGNPYVSYLQSLQQSGDSC